MICIKTLLNNEKRNIFLSNIFENVDRFETINNLIGLPNTIQFTTKNF